MDGNSGVTISLLMGGMVISVDTGILVRNGYICCCQGAQNRLFLLGVLDVNSLIYLIVFICWLEALTLSGGNIRSITGLFNANMRLLSQVQQKSLYLKSIPFGDPEYTV